MRVSISCVLLVFVFWGSGVRTANVNATTTAQPTLMESIRQAIGSIMGSGSSQLTKIILTAEISSECSLGLLNLMRGIWNLDPWAVRLLDATGKYANGLFVGTQSDLGSFDECLETIVHDEFGHERVRGQYCNVQLNILNDTSFAVAMAPAFRMSHRRAETFYKFATDADFARMSIGLCVTDDCSLDDLRAIAKAVTGNHVQVAVHDCVTSKYRILTKTESAILIAFGIIGILIVCSTAFDLYFYFSGATKQSSKGIIKLGMAFSLVNSTQTFLATSSNKLSEAYKYRFLHGMRVASILWIVFGHCIVPYGNSGARATKMLVMGDEIASCIITAGFLAVDTFFFMSGFLLAYNIQRQKANRFLIVIIAIVRRYIRTIVPVVGVIACLYLVPVVASGPGVVGMMNRLNEEIDNHWLELLLQVRNFGKKLQNTSSTAHLWYVSADFQLFVIALLVCMCFKGRNPWITIIVFGMLSLLCCGALCWQMYSRVYYPFVVVLGDSFEAVNGTLNDVYVTPWYHAASYFAGCITLLLQQMYGGAKISKAFVGILWVFAAACCLACVLMRYDWNRGREHAENSIRMACVFWDRILFSFTLSWIAFACSTGRGGFFQKFLAWKRFVPLSRLTFGVYLIHLPFLHFVYNSTRERVYYSKFDVVTLYFGTIMWCGILSFFSFAAFEVPTATLDRLLFERRARERPAKKLEDIRASSKKVIFENITTKSVILLDLKQKNGIF